MTDTNLDRAAQMLGYADFEQAGRSEKSNPLWLVALSQLAATLDELDAAKAELEAFKREVSDACVNARYYAGDGPFLNVPEVKNILSRFIIAKPDPLVDAWDEAMNADTYTEDRLSVFRAALAKHGLKLERIEHE